MVGRFQTLHAGHEFMIDKAVELCGKVAIFIGSSQEAGTLKNPFSYEVRKRLLKEIYGDSVDIFPLPDIGVGNNSAWGDYVLENVMDKLGEYPDLFVSGTESRRLSWLDSMEKQNVSQLYIPKTIDISASKMRQFFIDDNIEEWKKYSNQKIWHNYAELRTIVLDSQENIQTSSI